MLVWLRMADALWSLGRVVPPAAVFCKEVRVVFSAKLAFPISDLDGRSGQTFFDIDLPAIHTHEAALVGLALPRLTTESSMQGGRIHGASFGLV